MFKIVTKVSELPDFDKSLPIFSDIETDGLYTNFRMVQFLQPQTSEDVYILDIAQTGYDVSEYETELANIKTFICAHHTVWYNASYDLGTLDISPAFKNGSYVDMVDDMYYLVKTAYAEFGVDNAFGLKKLVQKLRYTKDLYADTKETHGKEGFPRGSYVSQSQYRYAAKDVIAISRMWDDPKIRHVREHNFAYRVDMMSQAYALIYQQNGLLLNRENWKIELDLAKQRKEETTELLPVGLNVNSPKQVKEYLGTDSSNAATLIAYALSDKANAKHAEHIINLRKFTKQFNYLKSINFDKMITKFNVAGAGTGRFTSAGGDLANGFNAQQVPRNYQYLFNGDTEDTAVVGLDYSTLELRLVAEMFGEPEMNRQLLEGEDLHTAMALLTSGKKLHPDGIQKTDVMNTGKAGSLDGMGGEYITTLDRTIGKSMNFGLVFGMSATTYQGYVYANFGIKLSDEEAKKFRDTYFKKYPNIAKYHANVWNNYKKADFFVYTALGRKIKPRLGTDGINAPIQGTGAETTKLSVHYLVKDNPEHDVLKYVYNVVHDAVYMRVPKDQKEFWTERLTAAMLKAWTEISKTKAFKFKTTPMLVD